MIYAVVDTNVLVSALLSRHADASTVKVVEAMSKEDAYLVTGNKKHFPNKPIVVTPVEMVEILKEQGLL